MRGRLGGGLSSAAEAAGRGEPRLTPATGWPRGGLACPHSHLRPRPLTLELLLLIEGLLALLGGLQLAMGAALVHGQGGGLPVGLAAGAAGVGLAVCVHHVVLVQARVLGEALPAAWHRANVWLLPWGHWAVRGGTWGWQGEILGARLGGRAGEGSARGRGRDQDLELSSGQTRGRWPAEQRGHACGTAGGRWRDNGGRKG